MKKVLFSFLLTFIALSCNNNNNVMSPSRYSREEIDKKYPYWKVGVSKFWVEEKNEYIELTVTEKKLYLRSLALMRLAINTEEFVEAFKKDAANFIADVTVSKDEGAVFPCKEGDLLDIDRLITIIRAFENNVEYGKGVHKSDTAYANGGAYYYALYGSSNDFYIGKSIWFPNHYLVQWSGGDLAYFSALAFHEHLHHMGFTHNNGTVYSMQGTLQNLEYRIDGGDLTEKYREAFDELTMYYFNEYKHLLMSSTVYDPNNN